MHTFVCGISGTVFKISHQSCSIKKVFLEISKNSQENTCVSVAEVCNFIQKETLIKVFSCEFCEIFKTIFFIEHLLWLLVTIGTTEPDNYIFKDDNRNTRTKCEICSKLTIKTLARRHWHCSGVFIINFGYISHFVLVFL